MTDRRQALRLEVLTLIQGASFFGHEVTVLDISRDGLKVQTDRPFTVGHEHEFRFSTPEPSALTMVVAAMVIYTRQTAPGRWTAGLQFRAVRTDKQQAAIDALWQLCGG